MSKRLLFLAILVIVLVSLNWFKVLMASELANVSEENQRRLLESLNTGQNTTGRTGAYKTPEIFTELSRASADSAASSLNDRRINDSVSALVAHRRRANSFVSSGELLGFDELLPFGVKLFREVSQGVPLDDIASTEDYVLGAGDNVLLHLWGRVEKEYHLTVDREGNVFIPKAGALVAWGLTMREFRERVENLLAQVYSGFKLTVSLGQIRSIRIYVTGEVIRPGAYTVSSLTSLFNAMYIAGGPNDRGSMRNVQLVRNGKKIAVIDFYRFLLAGDNATDARLKSGDVVFVPVAGPQVAIRGEITRPAIYELKGSETAADLLELAGEANPQAYLDRVMLERVYGENEWKIIDLDLRKIDGLTKDSTTLMDGDRITIYSIYEEKKNMVGVFGHVQYPGHFERHDSSRVSEALSRAQLQPYGVWMTRADLFRKKSDGRLEVIPIDLHKIVAGDIESDPLLMDHDSLHIYSIADVRPEGSVFVEGEVRRPGRFPLYDNMNVGDLIFLAGSYKRGATHHRAEIARIDDRGENSLIYLDLDDSLSLQTILTEDDQLYVRQIPNWKPNRTVLVTGEVLYPGKYALSNTDETLSQFLARVGGFTQNAFPKGIILKRASIRTTIKALGVDELLERSQGIKKDSLGNVIQQDIFAFDEKSLSRIIIDINCLLKYKNQYCDIVLHPGDRIHVPPQPSGISIVGAVASNGTISYVPEKKVKYYVERAGNFNRHADKKETHLIRAWGEVISGGKVMGTRAELGDVIVVPTRIEKDRNWIKTISMAVSAVSGVLTSVFIVSKL